MTVGVARKVMAPKALPVAAFDLASGLLCLAFRRGLRRRSGQS